MGMDWWLHTPRSVIECPVCRRAQDLRHSPGQNERTAVSLGDVVPGGTSLSIREPQPHVIGAENLVAEEAADEQDNAAQLPSFEIQEPQFWLSVQKICRRKK